nr:hypothetical protein [Tanacetum cinerariifolium]
MKALIEGENAMDKGVADIVKDHKRKHDDDDDAAADDDDDNYNDKTKRSRTKKSESSKKPSTTKETPKEPIADVVMDDANEDVVRDDDQPQDTSEPKTAKTLNPKCIELEYHFQECYNTLIDKLDWNNPEGDRYPFNLSKPPPLQGHPGHLTIAADYFFNNDLEYLKSSNPERTYTTSITKKKAARVKSVSVKKLHGFGHLEEVVVKIADRHLCKFKEGDFVDLHLNDIEDMLLLSV